jgi:hypothetical protein
MRVLCHAQQGRESISNDEIQMTNDETNPNDEIGNGARFAAHFFGIGASSFIRHSTFVLRHFPVTSSPAP